MSGPLEQDYYNESDISDDEIGGDGTEDIRHIIDRIDLGAIKTQLMSEVDNTPAPFHYFKDQQQRFNKYIPSWMDPNAKSWTPRHPALRPNDTWNVGDDWVFPSEYAKRWGVDKRAPPANPGRSMLSPNSNQAPALDWTEDFQAFVFHGYTADELKAQGAFDPGMQIEGSLEGLDSPLHPLVRRGNWVQGEMEGIAVEDSKLWYNYAGEDRRWDAATNDEVWQVIQPALQLMSKVLYSNHPFWTSIMDICKIRPMDMSRVPVPPPGADVQSARDGRGAAPLEMWARMSTLHYELEDKDMYPEARALRDSGFESTKVISNMLRAYVRFRLGDTASLGAYASTRLGVDPNSPAGVTEIVVTISPENVWPLLLPMYSKSEKFVISTALAAIMLHELAHCVRDCIAVMTEFKGWYTNPALRTPRPDDDGTPIAPELSQPSRQQQHLLFQLGMKIGSLNDKGYFSTFPQFFFQDEFRAEEGWAFENQLWGGILNTVVAFEPRDGFPQVAGWLQPWPHPMTAPRPWFRAGYSACGEFDDNGYPGWLLDPPPSLITRNTALPVTMMSRLYDEAFWSTQFARFSHEALRFGVHEWGGRPLRSSFFYNFTPFEVLRRSFRDRAAWQWISNVIDVLQGAGEWVVANWVHNLTMDAAGPAVVRRRFLYERRRWRSSDTAAYALAREVDRLVAVARAALAEYNDSADDNNNNTNKAARSRASYLEQARLIANAGLDIARLLGWEISALQFSVSECARLPPGKRASLRKYLDRAGARVERWFKPLLDMAIAAVEEVHFVLDTQLGPPPPPPPSSFSISGGPGPQQQQVIGARVAAAHEVLISTRGLVVELGRSVDGLRGVDPAGTQYAFSLLAERSSDRVRVTRVEKLALQRLSEIPADSPLNTLVTAFCKVVVLAKW